MDWDRIHDAWKQQPVPPTQVAIDTLRERDATLSRQVRTRDRVETIAAVVVAVWFALVALGEAATGAWLASASAAWLVAWAVYVPLRLHRARRQDPGSAAGLPLLQHLERQRARALAQARMLERAWLWYVAPVVVGLAGLTLATSGPTRGALAYLGGCLLLGIGVAWLNRHVARSRFRNHADALARQIAALTGDDAR